MVRCTNYKDTEKAAVPLDSNWFFKTGDSLKFKDTDYNDSKWDKIKPGYSWESQGYDYDGFAWYRTKFVIPSNLKKDFSADSLKIYLGLIDDVAQVFFNGSLLDNSNSRKLPENQLDSAFIDLNNSAAGRYMLGIDDQRILWDKENVIAIRVFDRGRSGGLLEAHPYLRILSLADSIDFNKNDFYRVKEDKLVDTNLIMKNLSKNALKGRLEITYNIIGSSSVLMKKKVDVSLKPDEASSIPVSLPFSTESGVINLKYIDFRKNEIVKDCMNTSFILK